MSKLALAWASSARAALRRAAPVTSRGAAGLEPRTVIASLNGLGLRHSAGACRPLRICSKPSEIWMPGRSRAVRPSSAGSASTTSSRVPPSAKARARLATKMLLPAPPTGETTASDSGAPRAARMRSTETAAKRNASAAAEWGSSAMGNGSPLAKGRDFRDHRHAIDNRRILPASDLTPAEGQRISKSGTYQQPGYQPDGPVESPAYRWLWSRVRQPPWVFALGQSAH